jgi:hypothetical protein
LRIWKIESIFRARKNTFSNVKSMAQCSDMAGFSPGNVDRSYGLRALHSAFYHPALTNVRVSLVIGESSCRPLKHCTSRPLYQSNSFAIKRKTNNKALLYFRSFLILDFYVRTCYE